MGPIEDIEESKMAFLKLITRPLAINWFWGLGPGCYSLGWVLEGSFGRDCDCFIGPKLGIGSILG